MMTTAPLTEPVFIQDIFVTGLAGVSEVGGNCRLSFFAERAAIGDMPAERVIVCHLLLPSDRRLAIFREIASRTERLN